MFRKRIEKIKAGRKKKEGKGTGERRTGLGEVVQFRDLKGVFQLK